MVWCHPNVQHVAMGQQWRRQQRWRYEWRRWEWGRGWRSCEWGKAAAAVVQARVPVEVWQGRRYLRCMGQWRRVQWEKALAAEVRNVGGVGA